jgi:acetyl-CoA C-acetyltransferase
LRTLQDGTAGLVVTTAGRARELAGGEGVARILGIGAARGQSGDAQGPAPAAKAALDEAGPGFEDLHAVTTHNPFAVNDLWFAGQTGVPLDRINLHGRSLV